MNIKSLLTTFAAATVLLGSCVVTTHDPYYNEPIRVAPPPPRVEYPGPAPAIGFVWINGFWNWIGVRYEWVAGRWEAPRPGHIYVPHRWERSGDHWRQHGGRWEPDNRAPARHPPTRP